MSICLDSSVIVAGLIQTHPDHHACKKILAGVLAGEKAAVSQHAFAECYAVLTGMQLRPRIRPQDAVRSLQQVMGALKTIAFDPSDYANLHLEAERRDVRGGGVYDLLHLLSAKKVGAVALVTLNVRGFQRIKREEDALEIRRP